MPLRSKRLFPVPFACLHTARPRSNIDRRVRAARNSVRAAASENTLFLRAMRQVHCRCCNTSQCLPAPRAPSSRSCLHNSLRTCHRRLSLLVATASALLRVLAPECKVVLMWPSIYVVAKKNVCTTRMRKCESAHAAGTLTAPPACPPARPPLLPPASVPRCAARPPARNHHHHRARGWPLPH
jgi:hypothetical protein